MSMRGGSFIEKGQQAYNVRAVGLMQNTDDIGETVLKVQNGTPVRVRDVGDRRRRDRRSGWDSWAKLFATKTARLSTTTTWSKASCRCARAPRPKPSLRDIDEKVNFLNEHVLPPGVKIVPHIDRDDLVHYTTHTVLHNLTEGILLVVIVLFLFLGNLRWRSSWR